MQADEIRVAVDVGVAQHRVGIAAPDGRLVEEFDCPHTPAGFGEFFRRVERVAHGYAVPVAVAMEGYNGHARPLDGRILARGWRLFNVNNLKLARFKEIFPAPAKSDALDTRRMLELFRLADEVPVARGVLQEVARAAPENDKLKRLSRRRRELVQDKARLANRLQADLRAVCPGLLQITGKVDNLWFLNFLSCRDALPKLARLRENSVLEIPAVGRAYARKIRAWQAQAQFAPEVQWVGNMILQDAAELLRLKQAIAALEADIEHTAKDSEMARLIDTVPGLGLTSAAELAGEIGALERFASEASLALYLGMACLDHQSGKSRGGRKPRQVNARCRATLMIAIARHLEQVPESRAYYERKRREGKRHNQAIRALGRHLVRVLYSMLKNHRPYEQRTTIIRQT